MLRGPATGTGAALRPGDQVHLADAAQPGDVVHRGADVVPVGPDAGQGAGISLRAADAEQLLLLRRQVALVVHLRRTGGAAIAGHVHREDVIAGGRQIGHPAVILVGHVKAGLGRGARAMDEQHDLAPGAAPHHRRQGALADIEFYGLPSDGQGLRCGGDMVIARDRLGRDRRRGEGRRQQDRCNPVLHGAALIPAGSIAPGQGDRNCSSPRAR